LRKKKGIMGFLSFYIQKIPVKSPNSKVRQVWDGVSIFIILYTVYTAMYDQAFFPDSTLAENSLPILLVDYLCQLFFWIDVIFNFFTAQFDAEGDLVSSRLIIAQMYMGYWFWVDVISNLPLAGGYSLLKTLRLMR